MPGECGLYKQNGLNMDYAQMNPALVVSRLNGISRDQAIDAVTQLQRIVADQVSWRHTPRNIGFPILVQTSGAPPTPIEEVKPYLVNLDRFCSDILRALQGK